GDLADARPWRPLDGRPAAAARNRREGLRWTARRGAPAPRGLPGGHLLQIRHGRRGDPPHRRRYGARRWAGVDLGSGPLHRHCYARTHPGKFLLSAGTCRPAFSVHGRYGNGAEWFGNVFGVFTPQVPRRRARVPRVAEET